MVLSYAAKHTYCKVRCEGDRSCPVYATAEKEGEEDAAVFEGSPEVIFIVLHSNAHIMMKVRDQREGGFFGTVRPKMSYPAVCALRVVTFAPSPSCCTAMRSVRMKVFDQRGTNPRACCAL